MQKTGQRTDIGLDTTNTCKGQHGKMSGGMSNHWRKRTCGRMNSYSVEASLLVHARWNDLKFNFSSMLGSNSSETEKTANQPSNFNPNWERTANTVSHEEDYLFGN